MKEFTLRCNKCGSTNISIKLEEDIVFNGLGYEGEFTGKLELDCLECKNFECTDTNTK